MQKSMLLHAMFQAGAGELVFPGNLPACAQTREHSAGAYFTHIQASNDAAYLSTSKQLSDNTSAAEQHVPSSAIRVIVVADCIQRRHYVLTSDRHPNSQQATLYRGIPIISWKADPISFFSGSKISASNYLADAIKRLSGYEDIPHPPLPSSSALAPQLTSVPHGS
jgi:hypothetical protein